MSILELNEFQKYTSDIEDAQRDAYESGLADSIYMPFNTNDLEAFIKKVYAAGGEAERGYDFGSYCSIEQKRYSAPNEHYGYKIINRLRSNTWVDVPVQVPATETHHKEMEDVVSCICCGVSETEVLKFRIKDIKLKK